MNENNGPFSRKMTMEDFKAFTDALSDAMTYSRLLARDLARESDTESAKMLRDIADSLYHCSARVVRRYYHIESALTNFPIIVKG